MFVLCFFFASVWALSHRLPLELTLFVHMPNIKNKSPVGVEPTTAGFEGQRAIQLRQRDKLVIVNQDYFHHQDKPKLTTGRHFQLRPRVWFEHV